MNKPRTRLDASGCGSIFGRTAHGISYLASEGAPTPNYIAGPVTAKASRVSVVYADGSRLTVPTLPPPRGLAQNIRFYVHLTRCTTLRPRRIIGLDPAGKVVASLSLHQFTAGTPRLVHC